VNVRRPATFRHNRIKSYIFEM